MSGDGPTTGRFRTEGGTVLTLALPLSSVFAAQLRRHELSQLDSDADERAPVLQPAKTDSKGLWEEYAISRGATTAEAKSASKADLVKSYDSD